VRRLWRHFGREWGGGGWWVGLKGVESSGKKTHRAGRREEEVIMSRGGGDRCAHPIVRRR
jgi:hypothetical protein